MKRIARLFSEYRPLRNLPRTGQSVIYHNPKPKIPLLTWYFPATAMLVNNLLSGFSATNSIGLGVLGLAGYLLHRRNRMIDSTKIMNISINPYANRLQLMMEDSIKFEYFGYFRQGTLFTIGIHRSQIQECINDNTKKTIQSPEDLKDAKWVTLKISTMYSTVPMTLRMDLSENSQTKYQDYLNAILCRQQIKME